MRPAASPLAIVALVLLGPRAALPKLHRARLAPVRPRHAYRRAWDGGYERWAKGSVAARRARVAGTRILLFDADEDGDWGEPGADAWTVDDKRIGYAFPFEREVALGGRRVRLDVRRDGTALVWTALGERPRGQAADAIALLNRLRMTNGIPPAWLDAAMSAACVRHSAYMERNGIGHIEQAGRPGYTAEGAEAGRNGEVSMNPVLVSIDRFWRGMYHRTGPCNPETREVGIGVSGRFTTFWARPERRGWVYPLLIPAPGVEDAQTAFDTQENPQPEVPSAAPGMPIQVLWRRGSRPGAGGGGELRVGGPKGPRLAASFSAAERPAHPSQPLNRFSLCLIPHQVLVSGKTYWVRMRWTWDGRRAERTWTFRCR